MYTYVSRAKITGKQASGSRLSHPKNVTSGHVGSYDHTSDGSPNIFTDNVQQSSRILKGISAKVVIGSDTVQSHIPWFDQIKSTECPGFNTCQSYTWILLTNSFLTPAQKPWSCIGLVHFLGPTGGARWWHFKSEWVHPPSPHFQHFQLSDNASASMHRVFARLSSKLI